MLGGLKCIFYAAFGNVASGIHVVVFWFVQSGATLSCCAVLVLANVSATNLVKHRNANAEVPHLVHSPFFIPLVLLILIMSHMSFVLHDSMSPLLLRGEVMQ